MDEVAIARLVLGYLREEGCRGAYKDFLKACRHLQTSKFSSSKYVPTRFVGLTLSDILREYYEIYQTVQGWLEATNYYRELHSRTTLKHQLLYLLNNKRQSSRASTPSFRSPGESHFGETSPVYTDHVSDIETTPAHKLPGNIQYESDDSSMSQIQRSRNRCRKSDDFLSSAAKENDRSTEVVFDAEILAQTLLENKDLPEKIAQTINEVTEKKHRFSTELNETIQTVVKKTAQDPIFDQILEEIIGSATVVDNNRQLEIYDAKSSHIQHENFDNSQKKIQKTNDSHEICETPVPEKADKRVEEQNAEAVQSIIDTSKTTEVQNQHQVTNSGKSDIIVFDGTLDKYILSNSCSVPAPVQHQQAPFVLNTNGSLLMVPSTVTPTIAPIPGNQYYILNKPPLLNCFVSQPTVLTDNDILAMPTVILTDGKQPSKSLTKRKTQPKLQPKQQIDISINADLSEFLKLKPQDEPKNDTKNTTKAETNKEFNKSEEKEILFNNEKTSIDSQPNSDVSSIVADCNNGQKAKDVRVVTPPQVANTKKTTPRSGSHVRNLNFSSPPKITLSQENTIHDKHSVKKTSDSKKHASKMLFKNDDDASRNDKNRKEKPWDANLRSFVPKPVTPNPKTRRQRKSEKSKKKHTCAKDALNTTEQDGALLEAALKTPVKPDISQDDEEKSEPPLKEISPAKLNNTDSNIVTHDKNIKDGSSEGQKTILSPSKLNANKRNIMDNTVSENNEQFITPEVIRETIMYPIKANRNIMPMLETPIKTTVPKTPGLGTPVDFNISSLSNFTPVGKMLEANLTGFDINLPTPNIPITPSFPPFTPTVDLMSPFSNRPTDYSTSSSYYQPSDNEQNKSLEAQLLEVEKKPPSNETKIDITVSQHLNIFNKNVIGKKNLNLMKRTETICSSSSSTSPSSSDNSEDEDDSSFTCMEKGSDDTVIYKKRNSETPRKSYSLRNRSVSGKGLTPKQISEKEASLTADSQSVKVIKSVKASNKISKKVTVNKCATTNKTKDVMIIAGHETVMNELEEKRQRTINKFKNTEKSPTDKQKKSGRFIKIKPIANVTHQRKTARKSKSPKKNVAKNCSNSSLKTLRKDLGDSDVETEDDISLRLSVSEDDEKIQHATDKRIKNLEKVDKSASDVEAQTLIEGLKERGIHLMHNKSTKLDTSYPKNVINSSESEENVMTSTESNVTLLNNSVDQQKTVGPLLDYSLPDRFDTCLITEETCLQFSESDARKRIVENSNQYDNLENFRARLYIDEIEKEIDIEFKLSDFHMLLDICPTDKISDVNDYQESSEKKADNFENPESDSSGKQDKEEQLRESPSPPSSRKRKYQDDEENAHKEKKCKKLLNKINVDSFLNNIHGNK